MRRLFKPLSILIQSLVFLLLAACSSQATPIPTQPPAPSEVAVPTPTLVPSPTATPVPTPTPVVSAAPSGNHGGSLTVMGYADIPHRDVHQEFQETLTTLGPGLAYSRLLRLRTGPLVEQPSLLLECDLCESWQLTPDFSYEFQLRPGVRWQNLPPVNGRELVADDLVYSYQRMQTPGWPNASLFSDRGIGGFEALDPHTLLVKLAFLDNDALLALADGHSKIVAREVVEQFGDLKESPVVGTGPWIWEDTEQGVGSTFSANPDYFESGLPFLDELAVRVVKPAQATETASAARLAAFQVGQVDVLTVPPNQWRELQKSNIAFNSRASQRVGSGVILWTNLRTPLVDDLAVRRAIFKAVDPWEYVDRAWAGQGSVGVGMPVPSPAWQLSRQELRHNYFASPSEAREILMDTGLDLPVDIEVAVGESADIYLKLARQITEDLRAVGFNPTLRALNPTHYQQVLLGQGEDYQLVLGSLPPTTTTNGFLLGLVHSVGPANLAGHQDSTLNRMIEEQASELDPDRRMEQLAEIQRYILDQAYMFSPVTGAAQWAFDWELEGFYPNTALSEYIFWSRAWLEQ